MKNARWTALLPLAVVCLLVASGCTRKPKIDLTGMRGSPNGVQPGGTTFTEWPDQGFEDGTGTPDGPGGFGPLDEPVDGGEGGPGSIIPTQERWAQVVVYFAYDSAALGPAERPKLVTLAQHLGQHSGYHVVIEGHCDERGSDEYNRALGETRALVVRDFLLTQGTAGGRIETISYGEERPVSPLAETEREHQKNRRAEFVIGTRR